MKFKVGDRVICKLPIQHLSCDLIYTVTKAWLSNLPGLEEDEFIQLREFPDLPYMAFRFKPYKDNADPRDIDILRNGVNNIKNITKIEPNHVDIGLVHQTASKNDKNKVDLSLIPRISNIEHAKAFMVGERKYSRYNYCKGHKASQLIAAAKRHLDAWFEREDHDPVDGQHHLGSVMACCSMILRQQELGTLMDDRFTPESKS